MQVFLQTFIGGLSLGAIYALVAMGFSIVYRTMGLVNFAHGSVVMVGAYIASTFYLTVALPFALAMVVAVVVTALVGLIIEGVLRPLETKDVDLMLIGTIGFGIVLNAAVIVIWGATGRAVPTPGFRQPLNLGGIIIRPYDLVVIAVGAVAAVAMWWFLRGTKAGTAMQAVAMDPEAATAVGIRVGRSNAIAFAIGAALAALAGGMAGPVLYVSPALSGVIGIKGFAAAILGGFGNMPGAIVGGLLFGLIDAFSAGWFHGFADVVVYLVFAVIVVVRPQGIFGEQTVSRA
jgi:branched-chain amino acid transport system permease protein